jgi:hypothetical protein
LSAHDRQGGQPAGLQGLQTALADILALDRT